MTPLAQACDRLADLVEPDFVAVPDETRRRTDVSLLQRQPWQGRETLLTLFNGHFLAICERQRPDRGERIINLAYLDARPERIAGNLVQRLQFIAALALLIPLLALWLEAWALAALMLVGVCVAGLLIMSARPVLYQFHTALGRVPVCNIASHWWQRGQVEHFLAVLSERIDGARVVLPTGSRRLAAELAEHRRMLVSGDLSRKHYEEARLRLIAALRHHSKV